MELWFEIVVCALLLSISISTYSIYNIMKNDFVSNQIWNELSTDESKAVGLKAMKGCVGSSGTSSGAGMVQVPLNFWFCRNPSTHDISNHHW